jgi:2,4-dienoyl-CoA reductase-like NADH-dependent reductase (Old Yellow Enzyme family)
MKTFSNYTFQSSGKTAFNRIALAPMTNGQSNADGTLGDDEYNWLIRRAKEGFGIIITCAANVSEEGKGWNGELGIYDDKHIEGLTRLAKGIKQYNSLAIVQIFHGGARSPENVTGKKPWSASAHSMNSPQGTIEVREGSENEIIQVISDFVSAAKRAYKAGFDGVELHGAHGYLLHQFLSTFTNHRSDKWGGSFENRARLIRTILKETRAAFPKDFILGVRLSPEDKGTFKGIDFDESLELSSLLANDGADYIHVSPWDSFKKPEKYLSGTKTIIEYFREKIPSTIPLIVAGEIWTGNDAEKAINLGADFVALGKVAIGNADWPSKTKGINYQPIRPPYSVDHLRKQELGESFITYMKGWKGFVAAE